MSRVLRSSGLSWMACVCRLCPFGRFQVVRGRGDACLILFRRRGEVRGRRLVMVNFALLAGHEIILCGLRFRLDYLFWVSFVCPRLLQVRASWWGFVLELGTWPRLAGACRC